MSDNVCENGYEELDEDYTIGEEYQEAEGDCVEDEYYVEQDAEVYEQEEEEELEEVRVKEEEEEEVHVKEEEAESRVSLEEETHDDFQRREEEESVELHGEDDIVFSQDSEHNLNDTAEEENEEVSQDEDHGLDNDGEEESKDEKDEEEEEETEIECTLTEEEKLEEYKILDGYQRQIDEEQYTLRKLRSIIGHQSEDIERCRKKIASYTKEAEDRKAMEGMEKLKLLKADRERAVEERRVSTDALAEVRAKRNDKLLELKDKGLRIDHRATYLIEDKELKSLLRSIRTTLKYNSFATLKYSIEELDDVIFNVANVSDEIDEFLTSHNIKPRDINKLNTKERRVSVLYDKLIKWRKYKVEDPDIRPTDYESFMYDPEDMFSDSEDEKSEPKEEKKRRDLPRREIRAVRGGSTDKSPDKANKSRARSPIRPPSPVEKRKSPVRPERRAVRGGSPEEEEVVEKSRDRSLRAERGGEPSSVGRGPPRDQPIRKRRAEPLNSSDFKRRPMSDTRRPPFKRSPAMRDTQSARDDRRHSPRDDRRSSGPHKFETGGSRHDDRGNRSRNTALLRTPTAKSSSDGRRSPSPPFRGRKENFQISVRNESYKPRSPVQERSYRHDRSPPPRQDRSPPRAKTQGYRGSSGYRGRGAGRRSNEFDRRQGGSGYRR